MRLCPRGPVSYTHLDVYKRQTLRAATKNSSIKKYLKLAVCEKSLLVPTVTDPTAVSHVTKQNEYYTEITKSNNSKTLIKV